MNNWRFSYPGQFSISSADNFGGMLYGVTRFVPAGDYAFFPEPPLALPVSATPVAEWGRITLAYQDSDAIHAVLKETVGAWAAYVAVHGGNT